MYRMIRGKIYMYPMGFNSIPFMPFGSNYGVSAPNFGVSGYMDMSMFNMFNSIFDMNRMFTNSNWAFNLSALNNSLYNMSPQPGSFMSFAPTPMDMNMFSMPQMPDFNNIWSLPQFFPGAMYPQQTTQTRGNVPNVKYNADTSYFNYDIKPTPQLSSHRHVDERFFNEVVALSKRLKCDPADLFALMKLESGIDPSKPNAAGSGAMGLIQFMPNTAAGLGTSTSALSRMSAMQQLKYVETHLMRAKNASRIGMNAKIDGATLYAFVYLPGRAGRETLSVRGESYYNKNSGLDANGDGRITKEDLHRKIQQHRRNLGYPVVG